MWIKTWTRITAAIWLVVQIAGDAQAGGLVPPESVTATATSPTEDYRFRYDRNPADPLTGLFNQDYYPTLKILEDIAAIDRAGPFFIGNPQGYHRGYTSLGFLEPSFAGEPRNFFYWDCQPDCNGGRAEADKVIMPAPLFRGRSASCTRNTLGHELFHKIQRAYAESTAPSMGSLGKWVTEGHARALQDKIYTDFDIDPDADCATEFIADGVDPYLTDFADRPLWTLSYRAALWWTYLMEQYGEIEVEPLYGVDFLVTWYEQALLAGEDGNSMDITDDTIRFYDASQGLLSTYRDFVLANLIKDMRLQGLSESFRQRYSYVDEQAPGQDRFAEVTFKSDLAIANDTPEDTAIFAVEEYAVEYFRADIEDCTGGRTVRVSFEPTDTDPFFGLPVNDTGAWGVVVGQSSNGTQTLSTQRPAKFYKKLDEDWAVEFFQPFEDPYETVYATATAYSGAVLGELRVQCIPPPPNPYTPDVGFVSPQDPLTPGPPDALTFGEVCAVPSSPIPGLDPSEYNVSVGGRRAPVLGRTARDQGHCLLVEFPRQPAPGAYELAVGLGENTVTIDEAVFYGDVVPSIVLALDVSASMALPQANPPLDDAKRALRALIEQLAVKEAGAAPPRIALVAFGVSGSDVGARVEVPLAPADSAHRQLLFSTLDQIEASSQDQPSIGSTIQLAIDEIIASGAPSRARHLVLLTDGEDGGFTRWGDVRSRAISSGIDVHTVALGRLADQQLLYEIARTTDAKYLYVDADFQGLDRSALGRAVGAIAEEFSGGLRLAGARIPALPGSPESFTIDVPVQTVALLLPAIQAAREAARSETDDVIGSLILTDPEGTRRVIEMKNALVTSYEVSAGAGESLVPGRWSGEFQPTGEAYGEIEIRPTAFRDLPLSLRTNVSSLEAFDTRGVRARTQNGYDTGEPVQLWATIADACALTDGCVAGTPLRAGVNMSFADGSVRTLELLPQELRRVREAAKGDQGTLLALERSFTASRILDAPPPGTTTRLGRRETLSMEFFVELGYGDYTVTTLFDEDLAMRGGTVTDGDLDGLPTAFELRHGCLSSVLSDADGDPDEDGLTSLDELRNGTDPCNPDSDGGGELDGSEVAEGRQPLSARDDAVGGIGLALIAHEITHVGQLSRPPRSITIAYSPNPKISRVEIMRSENGNPMQLLADTTATGEYIDVDLTPGIEYCYRILPFDAQDRPGRPSQVFCDIAREDPAQPWGGVEINGGRPRTDNPQLRVNPFLYNKDKASAELRVRSGDFDSGWVPYTDAYVFDHPEVTEETTVRVGVRIRDAQGLESPGYSDSIRLMPRGSLGRICGRVTLEGEGPRLANFVWLSERSTEPPAYTDADGDYCFDDLVPGDYQVTSGAPGRAQTSTSALTVEPDQETPAPVIVLPVLDRLFGDGFEA